MGPVFFLNFYDFSSTFVCVYLYRNKRRTQGEKKIYLHIGIKSVRKCLDLSRMKYCSTKVNYYKVIGSKESQTWGTLLGSTLSDYKWRRRTKLFIGRSIRLTEKGHFQKIRLRPFYTLTLFTGTTKGSHGRFRGLRTNIRTPAPPPPTRKERRRRRNGDDNDKTKTPLAPRLSQVP